MHIHRLDKEGLPDQDEIELLFYYSAAMGALSRSSHPHDELIFQRLWKTRPNMMALLVLARRHKDEFNKILAAALEPETNG